MMTSTEHRTFRHSATGSLSLWYSFITNERPHFITDLMMKNLRSNLYQRQVSHTKIMFEDKCKGLFQLRKHTVESLESYF